MGLRGSGKSTLGRELGALLGRAFVDLDVVTLRALGHASASEAFGAVGEAGFRAAEVAALGAVLRDGGQVVALGGGTPTAAGAAELLRGERGRGSAWVVYLHAAPEVLRARLAGTNLANRPALLGRDALDEIGRVYAARDGLYRELADVIVEVGARSVADDAGLIEEAWRVFGRG